MRRFSRRCPTVPERRLDCLNITRLLLLPNTRTIYSTESTNTSDFVRFFHTTTKLPLYLLYIETTRPKWAPHLLCPLEGNPRFPHTPVIIVSPFPNSNTVRLPLSLLYYLRGNWSKMIILIHSSPGMCKPLISSLLCWCTVIMGSITKK